MNYVVEGPDDGFSYLDFFLYLVLAYFVRAMYKIKNV